MYNIIMSNYSPINFDTNFSGPKKNLEKKPEIKYSLLNTNIETQFSSMKGPGRGFGNLNISNEIRNSNNSRDDSKKSMQVFDYKFQYLDKNFQDPSHIVMPIPRGGVTTRDQIQLDVDSMRGDMKEKPKKFEFKY